eukprot:1125992-Karenia_brevis.AAC.2
MSEYAIVGASFFNKGCNSKSAPSKNLTDRRTSISSLPHHAHVKCIWASSRACAAASASRTGAM